MMKSRNVLVTFLYPAVLKYFNDLADSINNQTNTDFDLIIFSDQIKPEFSCTIKNKDLLQIPLSGTPTEIRFNALKYLKKSKYKKIYFLDADDTMSNNRVEVLSNHLEYYNIVTNDLNLMNEEKIIFERKIWAKRLGNEFEFTSNFLKNKNIVGFGTSAINKEILEYIPTLKTEPIAADWFIFYQILKQLKEKALFTANCQTNYRQHSNNIAGIQFNNPERIKQSLKIRAIHYENLIQLGYKEVIEEQKRTLDYTINKQEFSTEYNKTTLPFWWEI